MQLALWTDTAAEAATRPLRALRSSSAAADRHAVREDARPPAALAHDELGARADRYVEEAHARNTRRAYQGDWAAFERWCLAAGAVALPASTRTLELYLTYLAELGRRPSTIRRARIAIGLAHGHAGLPRPDQHARVRTLERGIARVHGAREEGAPPLLEHELARAVRALRDSPRDDRDRAMLLIGFAGAFRSSDLAALRIEHVTFDAEGVVLLLSRSKEDQLGRGALTRIPFGQHEETCPVDALKRWIARVGRPAGPLFRVIRGAIIEHHRVSTRAVDRALKRAVARAGLDGGYSSHSLRVGLATSAYAHGATPREIQLHGRWLDPRSVHRYIQLEHVHDRRNVAEGLL